MPCCCQQGTDGNAILRFQLWIRLVSIDAQRLSANGVRRIAMHHQHDCRLMRFDISRCGTIHQIIETSIARLASPSTDRLVSTSYPDSILKYIYTVSLADDFACEFDPQTAAQLGKLGRKQLPLKRGEAVYDDELSYWTPACHDFPNIDSTVKLESPAGPKTSNVAYLLSISSVRDANDQELMNLNNIFFPDHVVEAEPPMFVALCSDFASCQEFVLTSAPEIAPARRAQVDSSVCGVQL
ncbi:hypothetical protein PHYSODRAFT_300659 [Phytophthora sojae]|uniref:Uncharacterized protein n=1 Tax=Phytophthora sojae (strain P6497) TaxID=1094619 RepID=G4ZI20_PHYSP|nr:hypothetical protein PHYSODRAFT_300659 [Phytophthora sojae]EGZ17663.1 hypothetical protein PHYSODRAFT_300659 [Phytophthora sojae]|eukprot:XP_009526721.1 hypothetical protein PHYSODRAFT_300659 [Phytophthora sojae]